MFKLITVVEIYAVKIIFHYYRRAIILSLKKVKYTLRKLFQLYFIYMIILD